MWILSCNSKFWVVFPHNCFWESQLIPFYWISESICLLREDSFYLIFLLCYLSCVSSYAVVKSPPSLLRCFYFPFCSLFKVKALPFLTSFHCNVFFHHRDSALNFVHSLLEKDLELGQWSCRYSVRSLLLSALSSWKKGNQDHFGLENLTLLIICAGMQVLIRIAPSLWVSSALGSRRFVFVFVFSVQQCVCAYILLALWLAQVSLYHQTTPFIVLTSCYFVIWNCYQWFSAFLLNHR